MDKVVLSKDDFRIVMRNEDSNLPMALPFGSSYLGFVELLPKTVGIPAGWKETFIFTEERELGRNYFLAKIKKTDGPECVWDWMPLFRSQDIATMINCPNDAPYIKDFMVEDTTTPASGGVAVHVDLVNIVMDGKVYDEALLISNLYEYFCDVEKEEIKQAYDIYQKQATDPNIHVTMPNLEAFSKSFISTRRKILKANPSVVEQCKGHFFIAAALSKLAQCLQRRYNQVNYDAASGKIADILANVTYMNDNGCIVHLSMVSAENILEKAKGQVRVGLYKSETAEESIIDPIKQAYHIV